MNATNFPQLCPSGVSHSAISSLICILVIGILIIPTNVRAETAPITPSGLHTQVNLSATPPAGHVQYDITGGTRPGGTSGTNLFHSFGDFSVPTNNIANFLNAGSVDLNGHILAPNLPTSNILGRVTGEDPSAIFGMIQTNGPNGFGNANLFLINPHGFLFGPNATLNVGGMVAFTTADYLRLEGIGGNGIFYADTAYASVLTNAPVAAFGFLGSNPAAIAVQGSTLGVAPSQSISLVGGNSGFEYTDPDTDNTAPASVPGGVTMTGGTLLALGGQINLVSVASPGEVSAVDFMPTSGMTMGDINLSRDALLDVSADAAGTVRIRGGQFVIDNATISANTAETNGAPFAIDVKVSGAMVITNNSAPAFVARSTGAGDAGSIHLKSGSLTATSFPNGGLPFSLIESYTVGSGQAGSIHLETGELNVATDTSFPVVFIDSGTRGLGNGGDVTIEAGEATFSSTQINTGDIILGGSGSAGSISIRSDSLSLKTTTLSADSQNARGGDVTLDARSIALTDSAFIDVLSLDGGSAIHIAADHLVVDGVSSILNQTALEPGGGIFITAKTIEVTNNSAVVSQTFGDGDAGNIHVIATDHITLADNPVSEFKPSGFYTNSFGDPDLGTHGNAGDIEITTPHLILSGGARINSTTQSSGRGGNVTVTAHDVTLSGQRTVEVFSELFGLGGTKTTGIYTRTVGSEFCAGSCGEAGHVTINTGSLAVNGGAVIDSGTTNDGQGGSISVNATDRISISGTMNDGTAGGVFSRTVGMAPDSGDGGNIALTAGQSVTISNGASVSASSTGPGNAGNITIDAGNRLDLHNSSITTEAAQASGGKIDIRAVDLVRLVNSTVSTSVFDGEGGGGDIDIQVIEQLRLVNSIIRTSVLGGTGNGGNIRIDPNIVVLQNSQILAQAIQGAGGNITIFTPLFLADSKSLVSASSQFGLNGTVTIQSPTSNLSGSLGPLSSTPSQAQNLVTQRCAALANSQASSFVVAGREQLPADPGSWLTSPLALAELGENLNTGNPVASAPTVMAMAAQNSGTVSLRRLTPAGFLIANFADSEATGCHS